jgi:hypothetical protein
MNTYFKPSLLAAAVTLALAACGGGGSGEALAPAAPATSLTLSGTAALGLAIANAPVEAKCSTGSGTATTQADGSYTIDVSGGSLPCVLKVTPATGGALHSVIDGTGLGQVTVNITPLTELLTARLAGGAPAELFASFDAAAQGKLSKAAVDAAIASIKVALQGVVDLADVNPIRDKLEAAHGSNAGNLLDQKLDALQAALTAAQTTLAEVSSAVANSATSSAPAQTILQPATTSCAGMRSGKYRVLNPHEAGHDGTHLAHLISVDAKTLKAADDLDVDHTPIAITADAASACKFTLPGAFGPSTVLVSKSGLTVMLAPSSTGQMRTSIVLPEQSLPLSELAGIWNFLQYKRDSATAGFAPASGTATIDAAGKLVSGTDCTGLDTCTAWTPPLESFVPNAKGGFNVGSGAAPGRAFAFKTASGKVSLFIIDQETGGIIVATKQAKLSLPAVGDVSRYWDLSVDSSGAVSTPGDATTTVKSVDDVARSYTRERPNGSIDTYTIDQPRDGMRHRAAFSSPTTAGGVVNFSAILAMPLPDTGVTVYTSAAAAQNFFGVSVAKR